MRLGQTKKISEARQVANSYFYNSAQKATAPVCAEGSNWSELGPNTWPILPANDIYDFHAGIGIMCFLKPHPGYNGSTNKTLFAGGPSGLWKSINAGDNWSLLNTDKNTITSCSDIAIHPTTNVLYLATGAHQSQSLFDPFGTAYEESRGLLKSTDGGVTWNDVGPYFQGGAYPDMQYTPVKIGAVKLHPTNNSVVYVVAYFWTWANNGKWEGKLFKSIDAGSTWTVIYNATDTHLLNMEFKPGEPGTFFVSGFKLLKFTDTPTNTNLLVPEDWTPKLGQSWRPNTSSNSQNQTHTMELELGVTPNDGNYLYVAGTQILNPASPGGNNTVDEFCDLWVCTDVTANNPTFTEKNPTGLPSNGGWAHQLNTLAVSTTDKNFVILGGFGVAYSSNGGTSFTNVNAYSPPVKFFHPDTRGTACATANGLNLFFRCHDAGICMSSDNCKTWVNKSTGLGVARPYSVAIAETPASNNPDKFIIGLQDSATLYTGTGGWEHARDQGGDGMVVLMDPVDPNIMYREAQRGSITKTINGWTTSFLPNFGNNLIGNGLWVTPMVLDPNNRHRLFVGKQDLGIADFTANPSGAGTSTVRVVTNKPPSTVGNGISAIGIAPTNSNILLVGYRFGVLNGQPNSAVNRQLFKSTDNGVTWTDVSPNNGFTGINNPVLSIVIHPEDPNQIFVTYGGYGWAPGIARVIRSVNGGITWTDYSSGLPGLPYQTLVINPKRAFDDEMYIGTDVGVFFRNKYMPDWQCFNGTLPNTPVTDLKINRNKKILYAATFGRGIWSSSVYCPASPAGYESEQFLCKLNVHCFNVHVKWRPQCCISCANHHAQCWLFCSVWYGI
jgi:hypothetical protein